MFTQYLGGYKNLLFDGVFRDFAADCAKVTLTPEEHQVFTNMWRKAIGYSNSLNPVKTTTATADDIWDAAQSIYAKIPALLDAARRTIFGE